MTHMVWWLVRLRWETEPRFAVRADDWYEARALGRCLLSTTHGVTTADVWVTLVRPQPRA